MASVKGKIARLLSGVALKRAAVVSSQGFGGFRRLLLESDTGAWSAGAKVQLLLPSDDMRTYTPIASPEGMILLGWIHASGPGARWFSSARPGDTLPFAGPQRSLEIDAGPLVIVGDETSVAVAAAFAAERPGQVHAVIHTEAAADVHAAAESLGLSSLEAVARGDLDAVIDAVQGRRSLSPDVSVVLTGGSELIVGARAALRRGGLSRVKTKAYWIPGRAGLD